MMKHKKRRMPLFIVTMLVLIIVVAGLIYTGKSFGLSSTSDNPFISQLVKQVITPDILLINSENLLPEDYQPVDLINLYEQRNRHFQLARSDIQMCEFVFEAMESMFSAAKADGVDGFIITSGYRSYDKQREVYATHTDGTAAKPGTSEHETGLAFDVTSMGNEDFSLTPQFEWLSKHCGEYGFILRYSENAIGITGIPYEPWHYRYVGLPHSKIIMEDGITLEEYLYVASK
jgi:D-alanyl-D-alanine carboxypeptidase